MSNVNKLVPLAPGAENDHTTWAETNAFHRKGMNNRYFLALEKAVLPMLVRREMISVLDTPSGDGIGIAYLAEQTDHKISAIGVDINAEAIAHSRELYSSINYIQSDLVTYLSTCEQHDVILCMEFLEHVTMDVARHVVSLIHDRLKPGGKAVFTTPRLRPREFTVKRNHHINEFSEQEFYYLIEEYFPLVERYSFDRYANCVQYTTDCNLMAAIASKWPSTELMVHE